MNTILQELGRELKQARKQMKISQSELSRLTGISQGDISNIENGRQNLSLVTLNTLCKALRTRITFKR